MTINCKGKLIDLSSPKVMGILNLTPDSFYDGGMYKTDKTILNQVDKMLKEGATFIDVGAYSSRPGADHISVEEEKRRLFPILSLLQNTYGDDILISVDTFRSLVAKEALEHHAAMINDISAGNLDDKMMDVVAEYQIPYVMMHMKGTPQTMKTLTDYDNLIVDIKKYFSERIHLAQEKGIHDIIIDPGFGFAKTIEQNFELLRYFENLSTFGKPILCGLSRKSMVYKTLKVSSKEALNGTTALHSFALLNGANILRVHDVKEAVQCTTLFEMYRNKNSR